jgi:hypothetical protein
MRQIKKCNFMKKLIFLNVLIILFNIFPASSQNYEKITIGTVERENPINQTIFSQKILTTLGQSKIFDVKYVRRIFHWPNVIEPGFSEA